MSLVNLNDPSNSVQQPSGSGGRYVPPHLRSQNANNAHSQPSGNSSNYGAPRDFNNNNRGPRDFNHNRNHNNNNPRPNNNSNFQNNNSRFQQPPAPAHSNDNVSQPSYSSAPATPAAAPAEEIISITNPHTNQPNFSSSRFGARDIRGGNFNSSYSGNYNDRSTRFNNMKSGGGGHHGNANSRKPSLENRDPKLELELYGEVRKGIEFKNYEDIPVETSGLDVPLPIESFHDVDVHPVLASNIEMSGYEHPTPVQKHSIPISLAARDVMACAQTGSGKCWAKGTELLLFNGQRMAVEKLRGGDLLLGDDNQPRVINQGSLVHGKELMYEITPDAMSGQEKFTVNGPHILVLNVDNSNVHINVSASQVQHFFINAKNEFSVETLSFSDNTEALNYYNSSIANKQYIWEISVEDYLLVPTKFRNVLSMYRPESVEFNCENTLSLETVCQQLFKNTTPEFLKLSSELLSLYINLNDQELINNQDGLFTQRFQTLLSQWSEMTTESFDSLLQVYNLTTSLPLALQTSSKLVRQALLSVFENNSFVFMNQALLESYQFVARSLGYTTLVQELPTGKQMSLSTGNNQWSFAINPLRVDEYFGFTVSGPNQRFLMADFTVTHNTMAFLLPMIATILKHELNLRPTSDYKTAFPCALVLAPTRELATQIYNESRKILYRTGINPICVYGGADIRQQLMQIQRGCDILVATPGRLVDLLARGKISLSKIEFLVFDEADRMLDMGFEPQIREIVEQHDMPVDSRQTLMFSATFPKEIQRLAQDFLKNYVFLAVGRVGSTTDFITQKVELNPDRDDEKLDRLMQLLSQSEGLTLIFVETKRGADMLENILLRDGIGACSIHGDKSQYEREDALAQFRCGRCPVLVATDVASRGLDIPDVRCVINYDLPTDIDSYVHRIGRTGRAGNKGTAISFAGEKNKPILKELYELMKENNQELPNWFEHLVSATTNSGRGGYGGYGGYRPQSRGPSNKQFGGRDYRSEYQGNLTRNTYNSGGGSSNNYPSGGNSRPQPSNFGGNTRSTRNDAW